MVPSSAPSPSPNPNDESASRSARELVRVVLMEAVGSSVTPFVPLPFVDDYLLARVLRRIARKVMERTGRAPDETPGGGSRGSAAGGTRYDALAKSIVEGYVSAGDTGVGEKAIVAATRFVMRKVAVVLDVKRSHDVFGESIAFALALDTAVRASAVNPATAGTIGEAIYRATQSVGSAALELLTRAGREAFTEAPSVIVRDGAPLSGTRDSGPDSSRFARVGSAIGRQVDETRKHLDHLMKYEISQLAPHLR
jgi:hypothetical protein